MYAQLPLVEDTEEEILEVMYKFQKLGNLTFKKEVQQKEL